MKVKCPKHPRYNPEDGEGGIVAGCKMCSEMYMLYRHYLGVARKAWTAEHTETEEEIA
jgi:hypothetical protein